MQKAESDEKRTLDRLSLTGSAVKLLPESAADRTDAQLIRLSSTFSSSKPFAASTARPQCQCIAIA